MGAPFSADEGLASPILQLAYLEKGATPKEVACASDWVQAEKNGCSVYCHFFDISLKHLCSLQARPLKQRLYARWGKQARSPS